MILHVRFLLGFFLLYATVPVFAHCNASIGVGTGKVKGIPTERVDDFLTTPYTSVDTKVTSNSSVHEIGFECDLGKGFAASVSYMDGLHASVERDVSFNGFHGYGIDIPERVLFHISERAEAHALRLSFAKYFELGFMDPFIRVGAEAINAEHRAFIPISINDTRIEIAYERTYRRTFPYAGIGFALWRERPLSLRVEYQLESIHPHEVSTLTVAVVGRFKF